MCRRKGGSNAQNLKKVLRKSQRSIYKLSVFVGQKPVFHHYYIQDAKDRIQIQVYTMNKESVTHFGLFILVNIKKILRYSQAQFREKLRKLRLRQSDCFLIKKRVSNSERDILRMLVSKTLREASLAFGYQCSFFNGLLFIGHLAEIVTGI